MFSNKESDSTYWDSIIDETHRDLPINAWRYYMCTIYSKLLSRWLPDNDQKQCLKTDLFEEAITNHNLLTNFAPESIGIDISFEMVRAAQQRLKSPQYLFINADLRNLPIKTGVIKNIFSGSSLDHYENKSEIGDSLAELVRILVNGGTLIITLDNLHNPIVNLRNNLPFKWLNRFKLVPYFVGASYTYQEATQQLQALGMHIEDVTVIAHAPRIFSIWLIRLLEKLGWHKLAYKVANLLYSCEIMERWPTKFFTGYYLALKATKPKDN